VAADHPRLLARRSELGYIPSASQALHGEPEAVSEATQRQLSVEARTKFAEARADPLARADSKRWLDRLRRAEMRARSKGIDIHKMQIEVRRNVVLMEEAIEASP
jgi:hypothetical protein